MSDFARKPSAEEIAQECSTPVKRPKLHMPGWASFLLSLTSKEKAKVRQDIKLLQPPIVTSVSWV